jgi:hypothetical protein
MSLALQECVRGYWMGADATSTVAHQVRRKVWLPRSDLLSQGKHHAYTNRVENLRWGVIHGVEWR